MQMTTIKVQHTLNHMIDEVEREVRMRREVYSRLVVRKKMLRQEANERIARMESVLATLRELEAKAN